MSTHAEISLVIPIFNESANLRPLIQLLQEVPWPAEVEWIFVDDASKDNSLPLLETLAVNEPRIRVLAQRVNGGKGSALQKGIEAARGKVIVIQDGDLEYRPKDLPELILPILNQEADVVYGSRFKGEVKNVHRTFHRMVNLTLTVLSNFCSGIFLSDMETCYKIFRSDILKSFRLQSKRFGFEPEVTAYVAKFRLRVLEFPIHYFPRNHLEGKKITWKDGIAALWFIFKYNFLVSKEACVKPGSELIAPHVPAIGHNVLTGDHGVEA